MYSSSQLPNHSVRSALPTSKFSNGPLPKAANSVCSSDFSKSSLSSLLAISCLAKSYRISTACGKEKSTRLAMAAYASRKLRFSGKLNGPGSSIFPVFGKSPGPNITIMHERLSLEPHFNASRHTEIAAAPGSGALPPSRSSRAARATTSRFGNSPSEMPSHTSIKKSVASHAMVNSSGAADTGRSSCAGPPVCLYCASPKARLTAKSPLTRATPMTSWTLPPVLSIRSFSLGWSGL
mmetsp:Transcript_117340/g.233887  ORF Transcript_117340/g.233887 Transcript_117340/m.233887 type:complete len:237 (-) Transcript_117340:460-1170(-)